MATNDLNNARPQTEAPRDDRGFPIDPNLAAELLSEAILEGAGMRLNFEINTRSDQASLQADLPGGAVLKVEYTLGYAFLSAEARFRGEVVVQKPEYGPEVTSALALFAKESVRNWEETVNEVVKAAEKYSEVSHRLDRATM